MYKINSKLNKFVYGILQNAGWILVIFLTVLILVFTQLGTQHAKSSSSIHDVVISYRDFGTVYDVKVIISDEVLEEDVIRVRDYYAMLIDQLDADIETDQAIVINPESSTTAIMRAEERIASNTVLISNYETEVVLIRSGALDGLNLDTWMTQKNQQFTWIGEYQLNRIFDIVLVDVYSWVMAVLLAASGIIIKIQGVKTGKMSGLKLIWKTNLRHATLCEKISPHSKQAERVCEAMNEVELYTIREKRLSYVALKYTDVFDENGNFKDVVNFVKPQTMSYRKLSGKQKFRLDRYQQRLLKKQQKVVEKLKRYYPVEVHVHNLLETKQIYKERFDLGMSIQTYEKRKIIKNIFASVLTITPMITAVSVFVYSGNQMNLVIGIVGTIINVTALLTNMFSSYAFITENYQDALIKKSDLLLQIGNELKLTDDKDNNWNTYIEEEELRMEAAKAKEEARKNQ